MFVIWGQRTLRSKRVESKVMLNPVLQKEGTTSVCLSTCGFFPTSSPNRNPDMVFLWNLTKNSSQAKAPHLRLPSWDWGDSDSLKGSHPRYSLSSPASTFSGDALRSQAVLMGLGKIE
jgi:hypothetical protein